MSTEKAQTMDKPNQYAEYTLYGVFAEPTVDEDTGELREQFTWRADRNREILKKTKGLLFRSDIHCLVFLLKKYKKKLGRFDMYANWRPKGEQLMLTGFGDIEGVKIFPHVKPEVLEELKFLLTTFKIPFAVEKQRD